MELLLEISVFEVNISKHNPKLKEYSDLSDYHYCHANLDPKVTLHAPLFYQIKHSQEIFFYIDQLEERVPKNGNSLCWDWTGIRDGKRYYLCIRFEACHDNTNECVNAVRSVFSKHCERIEGFDWPDIDFPLNDDSEDEWKENEYNDDSDLRLLDHCTKNNQIVRWERPYPESEGSGDSLLTQFAAIAELLSFAYKNYIGLKIWIAKKYYKWRINRLYNIICKNYVSEGSLSKPKPAPPKRFDVKSGKGEYVFMHYNDKEQCRKIIISSDGKKVRKTKFK